MMLHTVSHTEKTWEKMCQASKSTFCLFDIKSEAYHQMGTIHQSTKSDDFRDYIFEYQLAVSQSGVTDNITISDNFAQGLDRDLVNLVLSMKDIPSTLNEWVDQVSKFHAQKRWITSIM